VAFHNLKLAVQKHHERFTFRGLERNRPPDLNEPLGGIGLVQLVQIIRALI
jgi:hypothetical protein